MLTNVFYLIFRVYNLPVSNCKFVYNAGLNICCKKQCSCEASLLALLSVRSMLEMLTVKSRTESTARILLHVVNQQLSNGSYSDVQAIRD